MTWTRNLARKVTWLSCIAARSLQQEQEGTYVTCSIADWQTTEQLGRVLRSSVLMDYYTTRSYENWIHAFVFAWNVRHIYCTDFCGYVSGGYQADSLHHVKPLSRLLSVRLIIPGAPALKRNGQGSALCS